MQAGSILDEDIGLRKGCHMEINAFLSSFGEAAIFGLNNLLTTLTTYLPRALAAILALFIGWLLGKWSKSLVVKSFKQIHLDELVKKSTSTTALHQMNLPFSPVQLIASVIHGLVFLIFAIVAIQTLGLVFLSDVLARLLAYMPTLIVASSIFVLGVVMAGWLETWTKKSLKSLEIPTARLLAKVSSYATVVIASLIALSELGIASVFIELLFAGVVFALALAFGLALGLGSKDLVNSILEQWYKSKKTNPIE